MKAKAGICHLTSVHHVFDTRIFHKQLSTLSRAGYDVTLIAPHGEDCTVDGIRIIGLPLPKNRLRRMFGLTLKILVRAIKEKPDLYHFHDPELIPVGLLLKLFTRKKVIYDVHEDYPEYILSKFWLPPVLRRVAAGLAAAAEKMAGWLLDGIIVVTDDIEKNFSESRAEVVQERNYPELNAFPPGRTEPREGEGTVLIYAGLLNEERGICQLVRAMELIDARKKISLRLLGRFDSPEFQKKIEQLQGYERVDYRGWLEREEVWANLTEADIGLVCIHPLRRFAVSLPNKLFEYMSAGLPVIASDFELWKEIIELNRCGLTVDPLAPEEIAAAVEYLIANPARHKEMGENGRKTVFEHFTWERESKKLLDFYSRII
ncbi:MAG: glycosyltransferase family 4 protein [Dethiobacteria bacterium]